MPRALPVWYRTGKDTKGQRLTEKISISLTPSQKKEVEIAAKERRLYPSEFVKLILTQNNVITPRHIIAQP